MPRDSRISPPSPATIKMSVLDRELQSELQEQAPPMPKKWYTEMAFFAERMALGLTASEVAGMWIVLRIDPLTQKKVLCAMWDPVLREFMVDWDIFVDAPDKLV